MRHDQIFYCSYILSTGYSLFYFNFNFVSFYYMIRHVPKWSWNSLNFLPFESHAVLLGIELSNGFESAKPFQDTT